MAESRAYKRLKAMHPTAHWQRFESYTGVGVFDANACKGGVEIWVENKEVSDVKERHLDWVVKAKVRPSQIAWQALHAEHGARTFVALMIGKTLMVLPGELLKPLKSGVKYGILLAHMVDPMTIFDKEPRRVFK